MNETNQQWKKVAEVGKTEYSLWSRETEEGLIYQASVKQPGATEGGYFASNSALMVKGIHNEILAWLAWL